MNIKEDETGFFNNPLYTGQRPERILNNDDFPQPLGPVIKTCCPEKGLYQKCKSFMMLHRSWLIMDLYLL